MRTRGQFLATVGVGAAAMACTPTRAPSAPIRPPMLRRGDLIGLVSPASPLDPGELAKGVAQVHALGLRAIVGSHADDRDGYLAGDDAQRAQDFNAMIADHDVRGIFALRGGYGSMRILQSIDYAGLRADPKVLLGFSDITALLNAVLRECNLVTFHGPVAARSDWTPRQLDYLRRALMSPEPIGRLHAPYARRLSGGQAHGPLVGGNLSLVTSLLGTPYAVAAAGSLLVLEEVDEQPYRVDRMLTQLGLSGDLRAASGLIFGACTDCEPIGPSESADWVIDDRLGHWGRPAVAGVPVGHIDDQWVLPLGIPATLDADTATLEIQDSGVSRG
ncbi:MAG: S66 peptidase family protein [Vulcanimicrobiaceae bacterium]